MRQVIADSKQGVLREGTLTEEVRRTWAGFLDTYVGGVGVACC